jgi:hypothetical protein
MQIYIAVEEDKPDAVEKVGITGDLFGDPLPAVQEDRGANNGRTDEVPDKERGWTWTEEYRHQCEVRHLIAERIILGEGIGKNWLRGYLDKPAVKARKEKLKKDILEQWGKGNRGQKGMWFLD